MDKNKNLTITNNINKIYHKFVNYFFHYFLYLLLYNY